MPSHRLPSRPSLTMTLFTALFFTICLLPLAAAANGALGAECTIQSDCKSPLSCLAMNDDEIYSMIGIIQPATACEHASSTPNGCICIQPDTITGFCDSLQECDPSTRCKSTVSDCSPGFFCFPLDPEFGDLDSVPCDASHNDCTCALADDAKYETCGSDSNDCPAGERCVKLEELYSWKCMSCNYKEGLGVTVLEWAEPEDTTPDNCNVENPSPSPVVLPSESPSTIPPLPSADAPATTTTTTASAMPSTDAAATPSSSPVAATDVSTEDDTLPSVSSSPNASAPRASPSASAPQPVPQDDDGEDADVCVDAHALTALSAGDLVFRRHRRAAVLCDVAGSCATSGHMVTFHGTPMTMARYCGGKCTKEVRLVNSPRMGNGGVRVASKTDGLVYTALAARYESGAEEWMLSTLLRLGA